MTENIWRNAAENTQRASILLVDDEPSVLDALRRQLHSQYKIATATDGATALELIRQEGPFAVVVSDMRMPVMDGAAFLARTRLISRDTTRILLTGQSDMAAAISAINEGRIFRFLCKPCPADELRQCLRDAVEQHRLVAAEREVLEQTLRGSVKALFGCLELASPQAFARAARIRNHVTGMCAQLDVTDAWEIEVAAMLSQLGAVTLPPSVAERLERGALLSREDQAMVDRAPQAVNRLLADIPRLADVREIIKAQYAPPPQSVLQELTEPVRLGIDLLRAATEFEANEAKGMGAESIIAALEARGNYPPDVIVALRKLHRVSAAIKALSLADLDIGMRIVENVCTTNGLVLIGRGTVVTEPLLDRLRNFKEQGRLVEPMMVAVPDAAATDAPATALDEAA